MGNTSMEEKKSNRGGKQRSQRLRENVEGKLHQRMHHHFIRIIFPIPEGDTSKITII